MWTKRSLWLRALLLLAVAGPSLSHAQSVAGSAASDVLITIPLAVDGSPKNLQLLRGESIEDAALGFARTNGLMQTAQSNERLQEIIGQLSGLLRDKMDEIQASSKPAEPVPSVQLTIPLTIGGFTGELKKYEQESAETAIERFLYGTGFTLEVMRDLYPQLMSLVNQRMEELQPPLKELFSFSLTIDGREVIVRHFEKGEPMDEAVATLRSINIQDTAVLERVAPQIASMITQRIEATPTTQAAAPLEPVLQQQPSPPQPTEMFSMPLTIGEQAMVLVHYEGSTARETAMRFLGENNIVDAETINSFVPQLVQIIDNRMAELLAQQPQQLPAVEEQAAPVAPPRTPLVTLPINLGKNNVASLEYFEGDSVERTVELFLYRIGLSAGPEFNDNVSRLSGLVRDRLATLQEQQPLASEPVAAAPRPEPTLTVPITLANTVFNLEYFAGQEPSYVANTFCVEKFEQLRDQAGFQFNNNMLQECQTVLVSTLNSRLAQQQQQQPAATQEVQPPAEGMRQTEAAPEGWLMSLEVDVGTGTMAQLVVYKNEIFEDVANAFCEKHNIDKANIPVLVQYMQQNA